MKILKKMSLGFMAFLQALSLMIYCGLVGVPFCDRGWNPKHLQRSRDPKIFIVRNDF